VSKVAVQSKSRNCTKLQIIIGLQNPRTFHNDLEGFFQEKISNSSKQESFDKFEESGKI